MVDWNEEEYKKLNQLVAERLPKHKYVSINGNHQHHVTLSLEYHVLMRGTGYTADDLRKLDSMMIRKHCPAITLVSRKTQRIEALYCAFTKKSDIKDAVKEASPGAQSLYRFIIDDLIMTQEPFRLMNDGDVLGVYEILPLIFEFCDHPKLTNWMLIHLNQYLYWSKKYDTPREYLANIPGLSPEAQLLHRGDILAAHGANCKSTNEVLQEYDNAGYTEAINSGAEYTQEYWEKKALSIPGRKAFMREEKVACGLNRKAGMSEIRRLYHRFEKDSFKDDRKIIKAWLLELATSALRGEMDDWKYVDTFAEGLEELLKTGIKRCANWEKKAGK